MKIAEGVDVPVGVFDIETMLELFDFGLYDPDTKEWHEFQIHKDKNDLYAFIKFYTSKKYEYVVSFNGVNFDHQVLQYIVRNYDKWYDLSNLEICKKISDFSGKIIDDGRYDIRPPYREEDFSIKAIDLFKIHHFDNKAKMTSLKWCEFMLDMDVEEMPVHHLKKDLTPEEIQMTIDYRRKDVLATLGLTYVTIGDLPKAKELVKEVTGMDTELEAIADYLGKNKIQDRFDVFNETGLWCMNWSDVKIGEEWNKRDYMLEEGIDDENKIIPKNVKQPWGMKFKDFFPETVEFTTPELQGFVKRLGEEIVKANKKGAKKQEYPISFGKTKYTIAKGGIHSNEKHRVLKGINGWTLRDADVGLNCGPSKTP